MSDLDFNCFICEELILAGQEMYSCTINREFLDGEEYEVLEAAGMMTVCNGCFEKYKVDVGIEVSFLEEISLLPKGQPWDKNVIPIHNQYECDKCHELIRDGDTITSITHSQEIADGNELIPLNAWMAFISCKSCAESIEIDKSLERAIDDVISISRRKLIREKNI